MQVKLATFFDDDESVFTYGYNNGDKTYERRGKTMHVTVPLNVFTYDK